MMVDSPRSQRSLIKRLIAGASPAVVTGSFAFAAPLPLLGAAFSMTPVGWGVTILVGGVWAAKNIRNQRRRSNDETALASEVVASRKGNKETLFADAPDASLEAEDLLRSLWDEYAKRCPNPSLGGLGESTHGSAHMLLTILRSELGSAAALNMRLLFQVISPLCSYLAGIAIRSIWDVHHQARTKNANSARIEKFKQLLRSDYFYAKRWTSIAAHPFEFGAEQYLSSLGRFDKILGDIEKTGILPVGTARRNLHYATNQCWHAVVVMTNTPDFLLEAELKELLARSLAHLINAIMTISPYVVAFQTPYYSTSYVFRFVIGALSKSKVPVISKWSEFVVLQMAITILSSVMISALYEALEADEIARHRYVMKRLREMMHFIKFDTTSGAV